MFTSFDKAIVAFLGAIVFFASTFTGLSLDFISQEILQALAAVLTPILVYFVPNRPKKVTDENDKKNDDKNPE